MNVNVLLGERPVIPLGTIPVLANVIDVGAINISHVIKSDGIEWQLRLIGAPNTVGRIVLSVRSKQSKVALVDASLNHEFCCE